MPKKKPSAAVDDAAQAASTFEESLAEVEKIVNQLESGELNLADALRAYEQGVGQLRRCHQHLAQVERRIEVLVGFDAEGRPVTEELDSESLTLEQKQAARGRRRGAAGDCDEDQRVDDSLGLF